MIHGAYSYAGGIIGSGFATKKDMIENLPFWKLNVKDGKIIAVRMYKDKDGRKAVASATDSSKEGVKIYREMVLQDLQRSYFEVSDKPLKSLQKLLGDKFYDYAIPVSIVKKKLKNDEIIPVDDYFYQREIGGKMKTKIMLGNPNAKKIER